MCVTHCRAAVLSIITGGGKWVEITIPMDPLYLSVLVSARRCVQSPSFSACSREVTWPGRGGRGTRADAEAPIAHFIELESAAFKRRPDARSSGGVISRTTWAKIISN